MSANRPRGRYAPTPSGLLHVGNARTALVAWLSVRSRGGTFIWRLEDLDGPRAMAGAAEGAIEDLAWMGLDWDEGGGRGGSHGPYAQSARGSFYEAALDRLAAAGRLFPCNRSRKDLRQLAVAPHGHDGSPPYPKRFRPADLPPDWYERLRAVPAGSGPAAALRFRVHDEPVTFSDRLLGAQSERVDQTVGDFVLKRRDGLYAYQLAVVVDDLAMAIDDVVRGEDLLSSTARQIQLIEALGGTPPAYAHLPLVLNEAGEKISKRDGGLNLAALREAGVDPRRLTGYLAASLGLLPEARPVAPGELIEEFSWQRISRRELRLPAELISRCAAID